ncbi:hypothetical protein AGMMS50225_23720 [Betaproteobacteria bacterium]|nr:hypothetical protein AGMMS50225_23720 [Betaproteobacteria bacterium]
MTEWTLDDVAARFEEAVATSQRMPRVRVQGYFNCWPAFAQMSGASGDEQVYRFPPSPKAVERMLEAMRWVQWLEEEQRHLVWMRARRFPWKDVCRRLGCDRTTAWRRWQKALEIVVERLQTEKRPGMGNCH